VSLGLRPIFTPFATARARPDRRQRQAACLAPGEEPASAVPGLPSQAAEGSGADDVANTGDGHMTTEMKRYSLSIFLTLTAVNAATAQSAVSPSEYAPCLSPAACSIGPSGGRSFGPGGGLSSGPGGGLSFGPGGGLSFGPGGGMSFGPGGGLSFGPGGGMSSDGKYKGPWSPCLTGVLGVKWNREHC
jgi:hypothetical protein